MRIDGELILFISTDVIHHGQIFGRIAHDLITDRIRQPFPQRVDKGVMAQLKPPASATHAVGSGGHAFRAAAQEYFTILCLNSLVGHADRHHTRYAVSLDSTTSDMHRDTSPERRYPPDISCVTLLANTTEDHIVNQVRINIGADHSFFENNNSQVLWRKAAKCTPVAANWRSYAADNDDFFHYIPL